MEVEKVIDRIKDLFESNSEYGKKFILDDLNDKTVSRVEKAIGYKFPLSYIDLLKEQNGGIVKDKNCWLTQIYGIGKNADTYNGVENMIENWIGEWGYPQIGIPFGETQSAGHDMYFMDYRILNQSGEPIIVRVELEGCTENIVIKHVADSFEEFIQMVLEKKDVMGDVKLVNECTKAEPKTCAVVDEISIEKKDFPESLIKYYDFINGTELNKTVEFIESKRKTKYTVLLKEMYSFKNAKKKYAHLIKEEVQLADYLPIASTENEKNMMLVKIKKRNKGKVYLWLGVFGENILAFDTIEEFLKKLDIEYASKS